MVELCCNFFVIIYVSQMFLDPIFDFPAPLLGLHAIYVTSFFNISFLPY